MSLCPQRAPAHRGTPSRSRRPQSRAPLLPGEPGVAGARVVLERIVARAGVARVGGAVVVVEAEVGADARGAALPDPPAVVAANHVRRVVAPHVLVHVPAERVVAIDRAHAVVRALVIWRDAAIARVAVDVGPPRAADAPAVVLVPAVHRAAGSARSANATCRARGWAGGERGLRERSRRAICAKTSRHGCQV